MIQVPPTSTAEPSPDDPEGPDGVDLTVVTGEEQGASAGAAPLPDRRPVRRPAADRLRLLDRVGRGLVVLGILVLLFLVYQLWGTALVERRAQQDLAEELQASIEQHRTAAPRSAPVVHSDGVARSRPTPELATRRDPVEPDVVVVPTRPAPASGSAVARIQAPTIGLDKTVVEGVGRVQLREGPGRYPVSALPGHVGNVAIAGHRTTHGSPFAHLDGLQPGDPIVLETIDGVFTYRVEAQVAEDGAAIGHRIVSPDDVGVITNRGDNRLTLTSCHPRYSDRQRLVVSAVLEGTPLVFAEPPPPVADPAMVADRLEEASAVVGSSDDPAPSPEADRAPGSFEPALDEALGWRWADLGTAALWSVLGLTALIPAALLRRRGHRVAPWFLGIALTLYPLAQLALTIDLLAPAF